MLRLSLVFTLFSASLLAAQEVKTPAKTSLADVHQQVASGNAQLVDVRTQREWNRAHMVAATHVPITAMQNESTRGAAIAKIDKNKQIYVHCAKGVRAEAAAKLLCELGYDCQPLVMDYKKICAAGFEEASGK